MKRKPEYADQSDDYGLPRHCPKRQRSETAADADADSVPGSWEGLSRIWLTKRALAELNRRTCKIRLPDPVDDNLNRLVPIESIDVKALKRFARQGGPDLRDLRWYSYYVADRYACSDQIIMDPVQDGIQGNGGSGNRKPQCREYQQQEDPDANKGDLELEEAGFSEDLFCPGSPTASEQEQWRADEFDANFEQLLLDNGVYPPDYDYTLEGYPEPRYPRNWDEIISRAKERRPSLEKMLRIGAESMEILANTNRIAWTEKDAEMHTFPDITGEGASSTTAELDEEFRYTYDEGHINFANQRRNEPFDNIEPFFQGSSHHEHNHFPRAKPTLYDGIARGALYPDLLERFNTYISPSTDETAPILPNFFAECKGRLGSSLVAERQALYDGVLGVRAMHVLQSAWNEGYMDFDDNSYAIVSTFRTGELELYAVHATFSNTACRPEYHMNLIGRWYILSSPDAFREGVCAFRNLRDWAREKRDEFVEKANGAVDAARRRDAAVYAGTRGSIAC